MKAWRGDIKRNLPGSCHKPEFWKIREKNLDQNKIIEEVS